MGLNIGIKMPNKTIFDVACENFDLYFAREIQSITSEGKSKLPRDISFKLFRRGGEWDSRSTNRLSFLAKLFVLLRSLKKRFIVIIEDEEKGIGLDQYKDIRRNIKERDYSVQAAEDGRMTFDFYLGNRELMDAFQYLNQLHTSPAYNFLLRNKNVPPNKYDEANKEMAYIVKFIAFWESNKKNVVADTSLLIPEIYVLLCLFDGKETLGATIYNERFKRAYQSSPGKIKQAFGTLQNRKYIIKYGQGKGAKMQITALGRQILVQTLHKYAINC